jgi:hypothetical protein
MTKDIDPTISLINCLDLPWVAIFDNDDPGQNGYKRICKKFLCNNDSLKERHLHILNNEFYTTKDKGFEIHHLFDNEDRKKIGSIKGIKDSIIDFYYHKNYKDHHFHGNTIDNFNKLIDMVLVMCKKQQE